MTSLLADVRPLRESPAYRRLMVGQLLSLTGSFMTRVAVAVQVYALTGSSLAVGLVGLATALPLLVLGLLGGSIADALDRRRLVLATSAALALLSLALAGQALAGLRQLWLLYLLVALQSALTAVQAPATRTFAPRLLGPDRQAEVQALYSLSFQLAMVVGPLLAGVLIAAAGVEATYAVDALSFLAALWAVRRLPPMKPTGGGTRAGLRAVAEGLRYVRRQKVLTGVLLIDLDATVIGFPKALFPALAVTRLGGGARTVGLLYAAIAVGGVAASVLSGPLTRLRRQGRLMVLAVAVWSTCFAGLGLVRAVWPALLLLALAGAADVANGLVRGTLLQVLTPDRLRGRVNSVGFVVGAGGPSLGDVEAGGLAALTSPAVSAFAGGVASLVGVGALTLALPAVWRYDAGSDEQLSAGDAGPGDTD